MGNVPENFSCGHTFRATSKLSSLLGLRLPMTRISLKDASMLLGKLAVGGERAWKPDQRSSCWPILPAFVGH